MIQEINYKGAKSAKTILRLFVLPDETFVTVIKEKHFKDIRAWGIVMADVLSHVIVNLEKMHKVSRNVACERIFLAMHGDSSLDDVVYYPLYKKLPKEFVIMSPPPIEFLRVAEEKKTNNCVIVFNSCLPHPEPWGYILRTCIKAIGLFEASGDQIKAAEFIQKITELANKEWQNPTTNLYGGYSFNGEKPKMSKVQEV